MDDRQRSFDGTRKPQRPRNRSSDNDRMSRQSDIEDFEDREIKVGELAELTGISVRALHHYDQIGLLPPSSRSAGGHRLYDRDALLRLQQILSLRRLGLSLEETRDMLGKPSTSALSVIEAHLAKLRRNIRLELELCDRLEVLAERLKRSDTVSTRLLLTSLETTVMIEKYYTPDQLEELEARGQALGSEAIEAAQQEWLELIERARSEMEKGSPPDAEPVAVIARRWRELIQAFTGGNPGIEASLSKMWQEQPQMGQEHGMNLDPELMTYMGKAMAALGEGSS